MTLQINQAFAGDEHQPFEWEGQKGAVLLIHGFPGTPAEMLPLARALHDSDWAVMGLLLPGFGSEVVMLLDKRSEDWVQAVDGHLAKLREKHKLVIMIGFSMGGALCMQVAARNPPDALVLLAPFIEIDHVLWRMLPILKRVFRGIRPFRLFPIDFSKPETRASISRFMPMADLDNPETQQAIRNMQLPLELFAQIHRVGKQAKQSLKGNTSSYPILMMQGLDDDLVRPRVTRKLRDEINQVVDYVEVPGDHNLTSADHPSWTQTKQMIVDFCNRQIDAHPAPYVAISSGR